MIRKRVDNNGNSLKYGDWIVFFNTGGDSWGFSSHKFFVVPRYGQDGFIELKKTRELKTIETQTFCPSLSLRQSFKIDKSKMPKKLKIMLKNGINIFSSKKTTIIRDEKINIDNYMKRINIDKYFNQYKELGYYK